jgi:N-acetylmuramoyl-L-alanine amidase
MYRRRRIVVFGGLATVLVIIVVIASASPGPGTPAHHGTGGTHSHTTTTLAVNDSTIHAVYPPLFHSGACVFYPPTSGNRHLTVFLDAGHGGIDPGALGTTQSGATIDEGNLTLPVELDAMALLRSDGFRVVVSRTGQTSVVRLSAADVSNGTLTLQGAHDDVAARDICANLVHANLLVGIYYDAGGSGSAGSITTYDTARSFSAQSLHFAQLLQTDVLNDMNAKGWQIPNGGVLSDAGLGSSVTTSSNSTLATLASQYHHIMLLGPSLAGYFTTPSQMPGALIEPLFITDAFEGSIAITTTGQQTIARGIASAVEQYFGSG